MAIKFNPGSFLTSLRGGYGQGRGGGSQLTDKQFAWRKGVESNLITQRFKEQRSIINLEQDYKDKVQRRRDRDEERNDTFDMYFNDHKPRREDFHKKTGSYKGIGVHPRMFFAAMNSPKGRKIFGSYYPYQRVAKGTPGSLDGWAPISNKKNSWMFSETVEETQALAFSDMELDAKVYAAEFELAGDDGVNKFLKDPKYSQLGFTINKANNEIVTPNRLKVRSKRYRDLALGKTPQKAASLYLDHTRRETDNFKQGRIENPVKYVLDRDTTGKVEGFAKPPELTFKPLTKIRERGKTNPYHSSQQKMQSFIFNKAREIAKENNVKLGKPQLAAILAAAHAESSMGVQNVRDEGGTLGRSRGIFHILLNKHKDVLQPGEIRNIDDPETNLRLILTKINKGALNNPAFMNATTYAEASRIFTKDIEIPANIPEKTRERKDFAKQFYNAMVLDTGRKPYEGKTVRQNRTNNLLDRIGELRDKSKQIEILKKALGGKKSLEIEPMIGTEDSPNTKNIDLILEAAPIQYAGLTNPDLAASNWEKARNVLTRSNRVANKEFDLRQTKIDMDAIRSHDAGHEMTRPMLNSSYYYQPKGPGKPRMLIPPYKSRKKIEKMALGLLNQDTSSPGEKIKNVGSGHLAMFAVTEWEGYFRQLMGQSNDHKGMATALVDAYRGMIGQDIAASGGAKPFTARSSWNPSSANFKELSKLNFKGELDEAHEKRKATITSAGLDSETVWKITTDIDQDGVEIERVTPHSKVPEGAASNQEGYISAGAVSIPGQGGLRDPEVPLYGPTNSPMAQILTPGATFKFNPDNKGLSDEQVKISQIRNERLKEFQNLIDTDLIAKIGPQVSTLEAASITRNFLKRIEGQPQYSRFRGVLGVDLINGLAWRTTLAFINENTTPDEVQHVNGTKFKVSRLARNAKKLPNYGEGSYTKLLEYKSAAHTLQFAAPVEDMGANILATFEEMGMMHFQDNVKNMSPLVQRVYSDVWETVKANAQTDPGMASVLAEFREMAESNDNATREKGRLMLKALQMSGADRASNLGASVDSAMVWLGSLGVIAKDFIRPGSNSFFDAFSNSITTNLNADARAHMFMMGRGDPNYDHYYRKSAEGIGYDTKVHAKQRIKNRTEKVARLNGFKKEALESLKIKLDKADRSKHLTMERRERMKMSAILTARRTFDAIAMTYMFAGMVQGGSGGRAISNEDFENMFNALWAGGAYVQATNVKNALRFVQNVSQRARIIQAAAVRGPQHVNKILDIIVPAQAGLSLYQAQSDTTLAQKVYGGHGNSHSLFFSGNENEGQMGEKTQKLKARYDALYGVSDTDSGGRLFKHPSIDRNLVATGSLRRLKEVIGKLPALSNDPDSKEPYPDRWTEMTHKVYHAFRTSALPLEMNNIARIFKLSDENIRIIGTRTVGQQFEEGAKRGGIDGDIAGYMATRIIRDMLMRGLRKEGENE